MINSEPPVSRETETHALMEAMSGTRVARGAAVLAGLAVLVVIGIWFAFYMLVFLQRAAP